MAKIDEDRMVSNIEDLLKRMHRGRTAALAKTTCEVLENEINTTYLSFAMSAFLGMVDLLDEPFEKICILNNTNTLINNYISDIIQDELYIEQKDE